MAPAAVLVTVGERRAERCRGMTTPLTPAHSALRSRAPRLRGSVIPAATSTKGATPLFDGAQSSWRDTGSIGRAWAMTPWGDSVRALASRARVRHGFNRHPHAGSPFLDLVEERGRILILGHHDLAHGAAPDAEHLEHRLAPFDLIAPEFAQLGAPRRPWGARGS